MEGVSRNSSAGVWTFGCIFRDALDTNLGWIGWEGRVLFYHRDRDVKLILFAGIHIVILLFYFIFQMKEKIEVNAQMLNDASTTHDHFRVTWNK
jgi:hypothetical protein